MLLTLSTIDFLRPALLVVESVLHTLLRRCCPSGLVPWAIVASAWVPVRYLVSLAAFSSRRLPDKLTDIASTTNAERFTSFAVLLSVTLHDLAGDFVLEYF
jgi:hypothetical protein